jgi:hypothetical protein
LEKVDRKLYSTRQTDQARTVSVEQVNADRLEFASPCFVLSTGRCGTLWLSELLRLSRWVYVNHSDYPELVRHSRLAYEQYEQEPRVFCEIIRATRDELIINAYKRGQIYVETNNYITFFAHAVKQVYPGAKFIHLVRHPGDFVRSGVSRKWYRGHSYDVGRIVGDVEVWQGMSDIEKVAWLWNETNGYIENFLTGISEGDYVRVRAEDMFSEPAVSARLGEFVGVDDISLNMVAKMLTRKINPQRKWAIGPYPTWPDSQKAQVQRQVMLAARYRYEL